MKLLLSFILISAIFLSACHPRVTREISYKIECKNCGRSGDGFVSIDINSPNKQVDPKNPLVLVITNHTSEVILLNLNLFTIAADNYVVYNPIGINNPNTSYSWTSVSAYTYTRGLETPYYYNPLYNIIRKFSAYGSESSYSSYTETTNPFVIGVIPANSSIIYPIQDYIYDLYNRYVGNRKYNANYYFKTYWNRVSDYLYSLRDKSLIITIVYKQLNEANWRTSLVEYKCTDIGFYNIEPETMIEIL